MAGSIPVPWAVLTPSLIGVQEAGHLPNASTFCGKCESVCPMRIPLPKMMRHWREREYEKKMSPQAYRNGLGLWAWFAKRPGLYRLGSKIAMGVLGAMGGARAGFRSLPLAGVGRTGATCRHPRARRSTSFGRSGRPRTIRTTATPSNDRKAA